MAQGHPARGPIVRPKYSRFAITTLSLFSIPGVFCRQREALDKVARFAAVCLGFSHFRGSALRAPSSAVSSVLFVNNIFFCFKLSVPALLRFRRH